MAAIYTDATTNGNNLTNHGTTDYTASFPFSPDGMAVALASASTQYMDRSSTSSLNPSTTITLQGWFNFASLPTASNNQSLIMKGVYTTDNGYIMILQNQVGVYRLVCEVSQSANNTTRDRYYVVITPSTGTWYHYAVTVDTAQVSASTMTFYVNGSSQGNGTAIIAGNCTSINASAGNFYLGVENGFTSVGSLGSYLDGRMDEIRVYNTARTADQILADYNKQLQTFELIPSLVAYYPFEKLQSGSALWLSQV